MMRFSGSGGVMSTVPCRAGSLVRGVGVVLAFGRVAAKCRKDLFPCIILHGPVKCRKGKDDYLGHHSYKKHLVAKGEMEQFKHGAKDHDGGPDAVGEIDKSFSPLGL